MNRRLLEIISYVMKEIQENSLVDIDLQFIMDILVERGFSEEEISSAMVWLMNHGDTIDHIIQEKAKGVPRPIWRHLNEAEKDAVSTEAFGYLFHLRDLNLVSDDDMETILERAVSSRVPQLNVEEMQDLIAMIILDFETSASAGYFQFTMNRLPH